MQITKSIFFLAARGVQLDNEVTPREEELEGSMSLTSSLFF